MKESASGSAGIIRAATPEKWLRLFGVRQRKNLRLPDLLVVLSGALAAGAACLTGKTSYISRFVAEQGKAFHRMDCFAVPGRHGQLSPPMKFPACPGRRMAF